MNNILKEFYFSTNQTDLVENIENNHYHYLILIVCFEYILFSQQKLQTVHKNGCWNKIIKLTFDRFQNLQ